MANVMYPGNLPHIYWIDIKRDGTFSECAVMKIDPHQQVYFFELRHLDMIDRQRLARVLKNRNATHFELWDLMSDITLNNGVNALTYFHQLVKILTPGGKIISPQKGIVGVEGAQGQVDTRSSDDRKRMEEEITMATKAAAEAAAEAAAKAIRNASEPPVTKRHRNEFTKKSSSSSSSSTSQE